jgi:hypothetical protein
VAARSLLVALASILSIASFAAPAAAYHETEPAAIPDGDQGAQLRTGLGLAYCQPVVGAFFNFLLADKPDLAGWQSGVLRADWTPKRLYAALKETIASVSTGNVACGGGAGTGTTGANAPAQAAPVPSLPAAPLLATPAARPEESPARPAAAPAARRLRVVPATVLTLAKRYARTHSVS